MKTELHSIDGMVLSLTTPNKSRRVPFVLVEHGSAGIAAAEHLAMKFLIESGLGVAIFDHFTPLGISGLQWDDVCQPPPRTRHIDPFLRLASTHPWFDGKPAVMGFSVGGATAVELSCARQTDFRCFGAWYPPLWPFRKKFANSANLTLYVASKDDWCPINHAVYFVDKVGCDVEYYDACHGFCKPGEDRSFTNSISLRGLSPADVADDDEAAAAFRAAKFERGVSVKYDDHACFKSLNHWVATIAASGNALR